MAQSAFVTRQFASDCFVESCGAILFEITSTEKKVCLLHFLKKDEWLLPKGRRNQHESRKDAALREVMEETGYPCRLLPVTMPTRAPSEQDSYDTPDQVRIQTKSTEPFMVTTREIDNGVKMKLIWWYIAALDGDWAEHRGTGEADFDPQFFSVEEALEKLTYQTDREVLRKAVNLVENHFHVG
jgi:8-oxo-dGTP pyrophosphatase MutT (NUDIX family)